MFGFLRKRPLFTLCFFFTVTCFILVHMSDTAVLCLSGLTVVGLFLLVFYGIKSALPFQNVVIAFAVASLGIGLAGAFTHAKYQMWEKPILSYAGRTADITAVVDKELFKSSYSSTYFVTAKNIDGEPVSFKIALSSENELDLEASDIISARVLFSLPNVKSGLFPQRSYYASEEILLVGKMSGDITYIGREKSLIMYFNGVSDRLSEKLGIMLGKEAGGLSSGMLLGKRQYLPDSVIRDFSVLGISHLLSVSGFHIAVVIGVLEFLLRRFGVGKWLRLAVSAVVMILFLFMTGMSLSCLRAEIMMLFVMLSFCLGTSRADGITSLFFSSTLILILFKGAVWDTGFMLSVSASMGILTLGVALQRRIRSKFYGEDIVRMIIGKLLSSLSVSASALIFTLPVLWYSFGEVSVVSPLSNLIFVPLSSFLLYGTLIFIALSETALAGGIAFALRSFSEGVLSLASEFSRISPDTVSLRFGFVKLSLLLAALALIFAFIICKRRRLTATVMIPIIVFIASFGTGCAYHTAEGISPFKIAAVNRLKNDFLLVNSSGKTILCDISDGTKTSLLASAEITPIFFPDTSVDALYITHLHTKHISSIAELADRYHLKRLYLPSSADEDLKASLSDSLNKKRLDIIYYQDEKPIDIYGVNIYRSNVEMLSRSTQPIFYITVSDGRKRVLYGEAAIFESELCSKFISHAETVDAVILGIHGPKIKTPLPLEIKTALFGASIYAISSEVNSSLETAYEPVGKLREYVSDRDVMAEIIS